MKALTYVCAVLLTMVASCSWATDWFVNPATGHQYAVLSASTWESGEAQAVSLGGHLVTIRNGDENQWLLLNVLNPTNELYAYIGFYQLAGSVEPTGGWVWSSGEPVTFTHWSISEPNNWAVGENWAEMYSSHYVHGGYWNDVKPGAGEAPRIAIVEVIPEPSSLLALGTGLAGLAGFMVRKRKHMS